MTRRVTVIGAGTMGAGFVRLFAAAGLDVTAYDARPGAADAAVAEFPGASAAASLGEAVEDADVCIEAIVEELEPKQALFRELATLAAHGCVLATNTSALSIDAIASGAPEAARPRVIGAHFFNPPDVIPAVEVVRGALTSDATVATTVELLERAGKSPAVVADSPGFVANRIQHAMIVEAWRCVEEGIADAAAVDSIVSASFGFRLFAYGPFAIGDFNGLDVYESTQRTLADAYGERFEPPASLRAHVERGEVGLKAGKGVFEWDDPEAAARRRDAVFARLAEIRRDVVDGSA